MKFPLNGNEFEGWCADQLELQGWSIQTTPASGDQGVDLLATRDSVIVAIQCKRTIRPMGNSAVQEAFAGMKFYDASMACVISSGGFTAAARSLGDKIGVKLIEVDRLPVFSQVFGFESLEPVASRVERRAHLRAQTAALSRNRQGDLCVEFRTRPQVEMIKCLRIFLDQVEPSDHPMLRSFLENYIDIKSNQGAGRLLPEDLMLLLLVVSIVLLTEAPMDEGNREFLKSQDDPKIQELARNPRIKSIQYYKIPGLPLAREMQEEMKRLYARVYPSIFLMKTTSGFDEKSVCPFLEKRL